MLTILVAAALLSPVPSRATPETPVEVAMDLRFMRPAIEMKMNGTGPYLFILDSGAGPYLIVDSNLAAELNFPPEVNGGIGNGSHSHGPPMKRVFVDRVEVGTIVYEGVEALVWDQGLYAGPNRPRGIIGLGLFGGRLVTLDYPAGKVRLERGELPEPDGINVLEAPMSHNIPSIRIEVAGKPVMARLSTGSTSFVSLPAEMAGGLPLSGEPVEVARARTVDRDYPVRSSTLQGEIRLAGVRIQNPVLSFTEVGGSTVGTDLLKSFVVTIDKGTQRVRLISDGRPVIATNPQRLGLLSLAVKEGLAPVTRLTPGSPAEKAGVRVGDAIVKINGEPVAPMMAGDLALALRATPLKLTLLRDGRQVEIEVTMTP